MKLLVLGDIHGRTIWKDIIDKESFDLVIFLGDYVSSHEDISATQQITNLIDILEYKESNPEKVILLRGNHDIQHLGYSWAECSGLEKKVFCEMVSLRDRFLNDTQWVYKYNNMLFSHAGISQVWIDQYFIPYLTRTLGSYNDYETLDKDILIDKINDLEPCDIFGFTPDRMSDYSGESTTQPPTWIRPLSLYESAIKGFTQIVGHTPVQNITYFKVESGEDTVILCDCLANEQYLIIEDNKFLVKIHNNNENSNN